MENSKTFSNRFMKKSTELNSKRRSYGTNID